MIKFKKLPFKIENTFIVSDIHFNHSNYCKGVSKWSDLDRCRNFYTLEEMNSTILNNINDLVRENDLLISLGDFNFQGEEYTEFFRKQIKCKNIIYICGNHCFESQIGNLMWYDSGHLKYYQIESIKLVCCHYPIFNFLGQDLGSIMCHGHLHSSECKNLEDYHDNYKILDCGVDVAYKLFKQYRPFKLQEIINLTKTKNTVERH